MSIIGIYQVLPYFNHLVGRNLTVDLTSNISYIGLIVGLGIVTSLLAGSYPAFYLSSLKTISVVQGHSKKSRGGIFVRKGLVIFQFVIAIGLIIGALTIHNQMQFIQSKSLGFQKENKIIIPLQSAEGISRFDIVKNSFTGISGVKAAAGLSYYPGEFVMSDNLYYKEGATVEQSVRIQRNHVDYQLIETLGIDILYGRTFDINHPSDVGATVVMNETAVKEIGYDLEEAVGRKIFAQNDTTGHGLTIIGVIRDFNFMSLREKITAYTFVMNNTESYPYILVDSQTEDYPALIDQLEENWKATLPNIPFEYFFLDSNLNKMYDTDRNFSQIIETFTLIAIIICALGLFGLSAFTTEQRIKEIGIRKVLGASVPGIVLMLSKNFSALILFAFVIAAPLGWYLMNKWLDAFAFRIEISVFILFLAGGMALLFTLLVVSYQSLRAANSNPVETLKSE